MLSINPSFYKWQESWILGRICSIFLFILKNLNVWSDGGVITTNNIKFYNHLKLLRNHGLKNRDEVIIPGYNSRLDTFQAVVGNWLIPKANLLPKRIANAKYLDKSFLKLRELQSIKTKKL